MNTGSSKCDTSVAQSGAARIVPVEVGFESAHGLYTLCSTTDVVYSRQSVCVVGIALHCAYAVVCLF